MRAGQGGGEHVVSAGSWGQACAPRVLPPGRPASPGSPVPEGSSLCRSDNKHSDSFSSFSPCLPPGFSIREIRKSLHHRCSRSPVRRLRKRVPFPSQLMVPVLVGSLYWQPQGEQMRESSRRFQETFPSGGDCTGGEGMAPGPSTASAGLCGPWAAAVPWCSTCSAASSSGGVSHTSPPAQGHAGPFSGPSLHRCAHVGLKEQCPFLPVDLVFHLLSCPWSGWAENPPPLNFLGRSP